MKKGQKIWYIDNLTNSLETGILYSVENQSHFDEHVTLLVRLDKYNGRALNRIIEEWVFTTEKKGQAGLRRKIKQDIRCKKEKIAYLKSKLKQ